MLTQFSLGPKAQRSWALSPIVYACIQGRIIQRAHSVTVHVHMRPQHTVGPHHQANVKIVTLKRIC